MGSIAICLRRYLKLNSVIFLQMHENVIISAFTIIIFCFAIQSRLFYFTQSLSRLYFFYLYLVLSNLKFSADCSYSGDHDGTL